MSKTFEPIDEESAMSPCPSRATSTDEMASGMDVPAARIVTPMTDSERPIATPMCSALETITHVRMPIHTIELTKV